MSGGRRVVITGMGAVSSIGIGLTAIEESLRAGRSGARQMPAWEKYGLASTVGAPPVDPEPDSPLATRHRVKSSSSNALMAMRATCDAIGSAGFEPEDFRGADVPVIIGSGTGSMLTCYRSAARIEKYRTSRRISAFTVPRVMGSTASANVSVALGTVGESWSVSSACATGTHAIHLASLLVKSGRYDRALCGASEEIDWPQASGFDAMHALSRGFNDTPERASRPFDRRRDGFVLGGGAGVLLLESLERARARGATILAEIAGCAATSDGHEMVQPSPGGAASVMQKALADAGLTPANVDYVNAHGTSTPQGDPSEALAMRIVFGDRQPWLSSTKSMTGHPIGPAGSLEAIFCVLMLRGGFLAPNINLEEIDPECAHLRIVTGAESANARVAMSNSFGFGGTSASLILRRWD